MDSTKVLNKYNKNVICVHNGVLFASYGNLGETRGEYAKCNKQKMRHRCSCWPSLDIKDDSDLHRRE